MNSHELELSSPLSSAVEFLYGNAALPEVGFPDKEVE